MAFKDLHVLPLLLPVPQLDGHIICTGGSRGRVSRGWGSRGEAVGGGSVGGGSVGGGAVGMGQ